MPDRRVAFLLLTGLFLLGLVRIRAPHADPGPVHPRADAPVAAALLFGDKLDVNRADAADFAALPGIGPKRARKLFDHREARGRFRSIDELDGVPGIGPTTLERIRPFVTTGK